MSIHFVSGKPGGGKSLYAMKLLVNELVLSKRVVITNLPVNLGELNAFLQEKYPTASINLFERLQLLDDATETGRFWLYRGPGRTIPEKADTQGMPDYDGAGLVPPVLYIIDEMHTFFNSREWMKTGKGALFYASRHRHLGDDLVCVTQQIGNVDKQFRGLAQDFTYLRNHAKEKFMGLRSLNRFTRKTFLEPWTGAPGQQASEWGSFKLDVKGLGSCYNTAAGMGVLNQSADTKEPKKGFSVVWLIPLALVAVVLAFKAPDYFIRKLVGHAVIPPVATKPAGQGASGTNGTPAGVGGGVPPSARPRLPAVAPGSVEPAGVSTNVPVYVSALTVLPGGKAMVFLTDGRSFTERDPALQAVDRDFAVISGKIYRFGPLVPALAAPPALGLRPVVVRNF